MRILTPNKIMNLRRVNISTDKWRRAVSELRLKEEDWPEIFIFLQHLQKTLGEDGRTNKQKLLNEIGISNDQIKKVVSILID